MCLVAQIANGASIRYGLADRQSLTVLGVFITHILHSWVLLFASFARRASIQSLQAHQVVLFVIHEFSMAPVMIAMQDFIYHPTFLSVVPIVQFVYPVVEARSLRS